jgi:hypothetical protein
MSELNKDIKKFITMGVVLASIFMINPINVKADTTNNNWTQYNTSNNNSNNTTTINNNTNNGIIVNGNVTINTNTNNTLNYIPNNYNIYPSIPIQPSINPNNNVTSVYTNRTIAKNQVFDGTNGFKEVGDNQYVYYENGVMLANCWKEFDDGIRYFGNNGIMASDTHITDVPLGSNGTINITDNKDENKKFASGAIGSDIVHNIKHLALPYESNSESKYSLEYIEYMCYVFGIDLNKEYQNVYNQADDGTIVNIDKQEGEHKYSRVECDSLTIYIGKYASRLDLN